MHLRHRTAAVLLAAAFALLLWTRPSWVAGGNYVSPEILNSTLGFQQIFAINLPSRTDRQDALTLAAAVSGLNITFIDGVVGTDVLDKTVPGDPATRPGFTVGNKGSWRAHMNVLQRILQTNIETALILEDDADWDIRLPSQLQQFALAAQAFTHPSPSTNQALAANPPITGPNLPITALPHFPHHPPHRSPYGPDWDILWLGHCGTDFHPPPTAAPNQPNHHHATIPSLRVTIPQDPTVPPRQHLRPHPFALPDQLADEYPPHTRVVHAPRGAVCTQAYAVSRRGAGRLLWRFGVAGNVTAGWDLMVRDWCDGVYHGLGHDDDDGRGGEGGGGGTVVKGGRGRRGGKGRAPPVCVTVQPPLFSHYYGKGGGGSDIVPAGGGFLKAEREMTPYVRRSVRLNLGRLVEGMEPVEQWVEGEV